jgi:hypothetical protein
MGEMWGEKNLDPVAELPVDSSSRMRETHLRDNSNDVLISWRRFWKHGELCASSFGRILCKRSSG